MRSPKSACTYLLFLVTLSVFLGLGEMAKWQDALGYCFTCGNECNKCKFGSSHSKFCEETVCNKGPGEECGGRNERRGICGEGMYCKCNKCSGCYVGNLECFTSEVCGDLPGHTFRPASGPPEIQ